MANIEIHNTYFEFDKCGGLQGRCSSCKGLFIEAFSKDEMPGYKYCPHCGVKFNE